MPQNNTSKYTLLSVSRSLLHFVLDTRSFQCIPASKTVIFQSKPLEFWQSTFPASTFLILTKQVWDIILRDQIRRIKGKKKTTEDSNQEAKMLKSPNHINQVVRN